MADAVVRFDRSLYAADAVHAGVEAFGKFARIALSEDADAFVLAVTEIDPRHEDVLVDELANYVLAETAASRSGGAA
ncbi:MAG: HxsD-like protein [Deltaproteobacteria bacterium]|nr:HxsD-like protein [Deltaproteobacteria bacterium]